MIETHRLKNVVIFIQTNRKLDLDFYIPCTLFALKPILPKNVLN